jgi:hypothetical protein
MSADFRSLSSVAYGGGHTNTTIAPPAGVQDGDVLVLVHLIAAGFDAVPSAALPAGFTLLAGFPTVASVDGFEVDTRIAYKVASGESGDYVVSHVAATSEATLFAVSGGAATAPPCTINTGSGVTATALGLTTQGPNSLVAYIAHNWELWGGDKNGAVDAPPSGTTPTFTAQLDSAAQLSYVATGALVSAGATGDKTQASLNISGEPWSAFLLEVAAASAPALSSRLKISSGVF